MYENNEYLQRNDIYYGEGENSHLLWKFEKIQPSLDQFFSDLEVPSVTLLDVGGGTGHILMLSAKHIEDKHSACVTKYACELTPEFVRMQKNTNPDLKKVHTESICHTSFMNKEVDVSHLIDVVEHIDDCKAALREVARISQYAIIKIPLEGNLMLLLFNFFTRNRQRRWAIETLGHVQVFHALGVRRMIEKECGEVLRCDFSNEFEYESRPARAKMKRMPVRLINRVATVVHSISPVLCSYIFFDSVTFLVKCREG